MWDDTEDEKQTEGVLDQAAVKELPCTINTGHTAGLLHQETGSTLLRVLVMARVMR